jgi:hypothetical protein
VVESGKPMKYRITEFKLADDNDNKFFVEVGEVYKRSMLPWIKSGIYWTVDSGHKTFADAMRRIEYLQSNQPKYYNIK